MIIGIGSDHKGFKLKEEVVDILKLMRLEYQDFGPATNHVCDYPKFAYLVSKAVASGKINRGILISETGIDMCIVANKIKGIRAVRCVNWKDAKISREQNASNIICIGEDADVSLILEAWLSSEFDDAYSYQIDQISQIENV